MDELMKHLSLASQTINLFAAWLTDSNSLDCGERGGGGQSPAKAMPF